MKVFVLGKVDQVGERDLSEAEANELSARQAEVTALQAANQYKEDRVKAYPSIGDQLDMIYKSGVLDGTDWANAIAAVKADNPKPE